MKHRFLIAPLLLVIAGCGNTADAPKAETADAASTDPFASEPPMAQVDSSVRGSLPRYVGRWAAKAAQCESDWWRFWSDEVLTAKGLRCQIMPPDGMSGDTSLRLQCIEKGGKRSSEQWTIKYPAEGQIEVVRSAGKLVSLKKC